MQIVSQKSALLLNTKNMMEKAKKVYSICACIRNGFEKIETIKIIEELWSFNSALAFMKNLTKACTNSYIKAIIINDESRFDPRWYLKCDKDNNYTYDKNNPVTITKRLFNYFVDDVDYKDGVILINAWNGDCNDKFFLEYFKDHYSISGNKLNEFYETNILIPEAYFKEED